MSIKFISVMMDAGLVPPDKLTPGIIHRFPGEGKSAGNKAAWCMLFGDSNGGVYGDWSTGLEGDWHEQREYTPIEKTVRKKAIEQTRKKLELERIKSQSEAAVNALELWNKAKPESGEHKYLRDRNVKSHGIRTDNFNLFIPMYNASGELCSIQTIAPNGDKLFHKGGRVKGCYYPIGKPDGVLCLAEGFSTAATIRESTGYAVAACFNAGNLQSVAEALRKKLPTTKFIICADDDHKLSVNTGLKKAQAAADSIDGVVAVPEFANDRPNNATDFNDMAKLKGNAAVAEVIKRDQQNDEIDLNEEWPKPETLPDELPPVAEFDINLIPDSLRAWVLDISNRMQCAPDYIAVTVMVALGSLIGRKIAIRPQQKSDWTVVANQWSMLIGRPGHMKSPAMEAGLAPLKRLEAQANEEYQQIIKDSKAQESINKLKSESIEKKARGLLKEDSTADVSLLFDDMPDEEPPVRKRYTVNDSNIASLGEIHRQNENGILVFRDELVSLLKNLDREDKAEDRGFYLTGWNGDSSYTFDRIGRGLHLHIPAVCISVLGSTQPGRISEYVRHAVKGGMGDDGLLQRFGLMVWPDDKQIWKNVDQWPDSDAKNRAIKVFDFLDELDPVKVGADQDADSEGNLSGIHYLRFNEEASEVFVKWRTSFENRLRSDDLHQSIESHLAKYRKLVPGLALIHHLASGFTGGVSHESLLAALSWSEYLETHANRVYASVTMLNSSAAKAILKRIRSGDIQDEFTARDIYKNHWQKLDKDSVYEGLVMLTDYGWLKSVMKETGGRPSTQYCIHPELKS